MASPHRQPPAHASWLPIPARSIAVVEHPCIVENPDKAIQSLGGPRNLSTALLRSEPDAAPSTSAAPSALKPTQFVSASLRPEDPSAKRLLATPLSTNNILLKLTVPKRTGRKRKRGSSGPFLNDCDVESPCPGSSSTKTDYVDAKTVFRCLRDNADKYKVTPVGIVDESHRFRTLPDIQVATYQNELLKRVMEHSTPLRLSSIKNFPLNTEPGADLAQSTPVSADYLQMPVHYNYKFQQNQFVKYTADSRGEVNIQKRHTVNGYYFINMDAKSVPTGPKPSLPPESTLTPYLQSLIADIRAELAKRPIITRHILYNTIGWDKRDRIREAGVFCGYFFSSGPWREAIIRWGVDPRKDPIYRHYQTISFISFDRLGTQHNRYLADKDLRELARKDPQELRNQHVFDGVTLGHTGNIFMFCDITDPTIRKVLDTEDIRSSCAPTFQGWYHIGTWAKATVILKDKMNRIITGNAPDPTFYDRVLTWPELWKDRDVYETYRMEIFDKELHKEKAAEHHLMNTIRWAAKSPRYAFERIERSKNASGSAAGDADEEAELEVPEDLTEARDDVEAILVEGGDEETDGSPSDDSEEGSFDDESDDEAQAGGEGEDEDGDAEGSDLGEEDEEEEDGDV